MSTATIHAFPPPKAALERTELEQFILDSYHCRHGQEPGAGCARCPYGVAVQPITVIGWNDHGRPMLLSELLELAGLSNAGATGTKVGP